MKEKVLEMSYKIVMPQLGLTMEEGSVTSWLKQPGEFVEKGEALFTVETDKVEMEVESMGKGYLGPIQVELGLKVAVGTLLTTLTDEPETAA
jgi:pyruvate dehydrogenase E2 component (dihydrolipoamide acetyltransferase)